MKLIKACLKAFLNFIGKDRIRGLVFSDIENKLISFRNNSYLESTGWINSYEKKQPLDNSDNPIPWTTYSYIFFIEKRLNKNIDMFEFGSGNSTIFYSYLVNVVNSVEHDLDWFGKVKDLAPANAVVNFQELIRGGDYSKFALKSDKRYHVIVVDGRDRVNCCVNSINALFSDGVLVLDDSERPQYNEAVQFLVDNSFRKIDFWGMAPGISFNKCTSIFYREQNCLGI